MVVAVSSVILGTARLLLTPHLLRLLGVAPDVYAGALGFMRVSFIGIIFVFLYAMFQALMRGIGETKHPALYRARHRALELRSRSSFHLRLGAGAGTASRERRSPRLATQALAALARHDILLRGRHGIALAWSALRPDIAYIKRAFFLGFPGSIELSTRGLGLVIMSFLVASFGTLTDRGLWRRIQLRAGGHDPGDGLVDGRLHPGRPEHRRRQCRARSAHRAPGQRDRVRRALPGRYSRLCFRAAARGIFRAGRCRGDCRGRPLHPHHVPRLGRHRHPALRGGDVPRVWATC